MKKLLTISLLIIISAITQGQELNLYCQKADVIAKMHSFPEYRRIVKMADYLEYQQGATAIGYRFFNDSTDMYFGKWICYEAYYTIPDSSEYEFTQGKVACKCWIELGNNTWEYINNIYSGTVIVTRLKQPGSVTFIYRFQDEERVGL